MATTKDSVSDVTALWLRLEERFKAFTDERDKAFRYIISDQIDSDVREKLKKANRPALVYNLLQPLIIYIAGVLNANRQRFRARPMRAGDETLSDLHTVLVSDWAMAGCDGYDEIAKAAIDAAIGKVGWTNNYWTYRDDPEGKWVTEHYDGRQVFWDPDGRKTDQTDWRYMLATGFYSADEIVSIYELKGEAASKVIRSAQTLEAEYIEGQRGMPRSWLNRAWSSVSDFFVKKGVREFANRPSDFADLRQGIYRVIEFDDKRWRKRMYIYSPMTRERIPAPEYLMDARVDDRVRKQVLEDYSSKLPFARYEKMDVDELWRIVVCPSLVKDEFLLEKPYAVQDVGFHLKPIFCYDFHPDLLSTQAILDSLIDPQDSYNQRRMSQLEWLMDSINPNTIALVNSIPPAEIPNWKGKRRGIIKQYSTPGARPEREQPLPGGASLARFAEEDKNLVETISGLNANLKGFQQGSGESGILYARRVEQGMLMLNFFFAQVRRTMGSIFRYCDRSLQHFLTYERELRIVAEGDAAEWLKVNEKTLEGVKNDITQGRYDFTPDTTKIDASTKQLKFIEALELAKAVPPNLFYWPGVFEYWDSPLAPKFKDWAEKAMGVQSQRQEQIGNIQDASQVAGVLSSLAKAGAPSNGAGEPAPAGPVEAGAPE